jgi:hypothetical protein
MATNKPTQRSVYAGFMAQIFMVYVIKFVPHNLFYRPKALHILDRPIAGMILILPPILSSHPLIKFRLNVRGIYIDEILCQAQTDLTQFSSLKFRKLEFRYLYIETIIIETIWAVAIITRALAFVEFPPQNKMASENY